MPAAARPRAPHPSPPLSLRWSSPERHLWVATRNGEYAGMAVFDRRVGYTSTGPTAERIGSFPCLEAAQRALEPRG